MAAADIETRVQQCLARHEAPVKQEYLRADNVGLPVSAPNTAASAAAAAIVEPAKSKSKQRKEAKQFRKDTQLCHGFLAGHCRFGSKCKHSHDAESYFANRMEDLPGTCPFIHTGDCQYGVSCRWASTHKATDELHTKLREYLAQKATEKAAVASAATDNSTDPAASSAENASGTQGTQVVTLSRVNDIPSAGVVFLTPATAIQPSMNALSKEVQQQLWKSRYDFTRADSVLKDMGLRISFKTNGHLNKQQPQQQAKQAPDVHNSNTDSAAVTLPTLNSTLHAQAEVAAAAEPNAVTNGETDNTAGDAGLLKQEDDGNVKEPAAKRARIEETAKGVEPSVIQHASEDVDMQTAAAVGSDAAAVSQIAADQQQQQQVALGSTNNGQATVTTANNDAMSMDTPAAMHVETPLKSNEKKVIDFRGKTVLAPLTTVGNLPFRRVCKVLGADVTVGEMALCTNLLQGQASEWALLKRHPSEDLFGVQIAGGFPDAVARACQLIDETCTAVDFVDINMGCPIDIVCDRGAGSALLLRPNRIAEIARAADRSMSLPLTLKTRKGYYDDKDVTHTFVNEIRGWGPIALTLHGRTRQQRYSRQADWSYIQRCAEAAHPTGLQLIGNGDVFSYTDWNEHVGNGQGPLASCMVGRGALIKPWVFTEIREQRHWDISAGERLDLFKSFCSAGLEHWGSDNRGVETTRKFLLEWLSYTHRYVPVGLLEVLPQKLHWRTPAIYGRSDLETLLSSEHPSDWIRISEMLLGRAPAGFTFTPKHKSNAYSSAAAAAQQASTNATAYEADDQAEG